MKSMESNTRRQERIANRARLSTKTFKNKKAYDRKRANRDLVRARAEA